MEQITLMVDLKSQYIQKVCFECFSMSHLHCSFPVSSFLYFFLPPSRQPNGYIICTVLSTLADDNMGYITVTTGDPATFSCEFLRRDTDFNITWKIRGFEYPCDSLQKDSGVQCYIAGNASVLQIVNTTVLGTGTHEVKCILQPNIHQNYTNDVSFQSELNENITRTATLEVMMEVTSTMSEFHCIPFPTLSLYCCKLGCTHLHILINGLFPFSRCISNCSTDTRK